MSKDQGLEMGNEMPLVSVVIPTYRRSHFLLSALDSVVSQTYPNLEIIIVDDNDNADESHEVKRVLSPYGDKVKRIPNNRTKGGCGARNAGIVVAVGDYVAFLDDDDVWLPEKLTLQIELLRTHPEFSGAMCHFIEVDNTVSSKRVRRTGRPEMRMEHVLAGECPTSTSLMLLKRDVLIRAGLFDESMPSFQDYDMWLRCLPFGSFGCVEKPLALFVQHDGDRTSVNISRRLAGLAVVEKKWSSVMKPFGGFPKFKRQIKAELFFSNGKVFFGKDYGVAVWYFLRAVLASNLKLRYLYWLGMSLCGKRFGIFIFHSLMRYKLQWKSVREIR